MKSKSELRETDIKNGVRYYFDNIINGTEINFRNNFLDKTYMKIFQSIAFRIKLQQAQIHCVLDSIK